MTLSPPAATCPDREKLTDFSLGKVTDNDLVALASHVEACETCLAELTVVNANDDTLVALLRRRAEPSQFDDEGALKHTLTRIREIGRDPSFSSMAPARKQSELGAIRDYKLLSLLGEGGMGAVYKALHTQLEKIVALKVLPAERMQPDAVARFRREMRAVGKLHHPNIVQAFDAGEHEGKHFLVMECVDGVDLHTLVSQHGPLNFADACEIVRQTADGLQHAHQHGLVHRDIKPSNLMLTRAGQVKVLDMGLALLQESTNQGDELTATCQIMGTPDYVAPEQAGDSHAVDIRADIYSLGCTLFKLVTGNVPYPPPQFKTAVQKMAGHISRPFPDISTQRRDIPKSLKKILSRMTAKQPADRYATPGDVAAALAPLAAGHNLAALMTPTDHASKGDSAQTLATNPHVSALLDTIQPSKTLAAPRGADFQPAKTTSLVGRRSLFPPYILLAAAAAALIAAAVTIIKVQTRDGTLVLNVEGPNAVVTIDGETAKVALDADGRTHRISVDPGTHTLVVTTPDGIRYKTDNHFTMDAGGVARLTARLEKAEDAPVAKVAPVSISKNYALDLSAPAGQPFPFVELPKGFTPEQPITVEMTVLPRSLAAPKATRSLWMMGRLLALREVGGLWSWIGMETNVDGSVNHVNVTTRSAATPGQPTCLAAVSTGKELRLFVDGKLIGSRPVVALAGDNSGHFLANPALSKDSPGWNPFDGTIDEVRISTIARYSADYTPRERLETDKDTFALYHCDEGQGDVLVDSSGNKRDGKIVGPKWVREDAGSKAPLIASLGTSESRPSTPAVASSAARNFALDMSAAPGLGAIVTLPKGLVCEQPCTVEMTVCPRSLAGPTESRGLWTVNPQLSLKQYAGRWQWFGSHSINPTGTFEQQFASVSTKDSATPGQRTHLAAVSTGKELRLFVDGKLIGSSAVSLLATEVRGHDLGISPNTAKGPGWGTFDGTIDEVRISTIARYSVNYIPRERLEADKDTFALYHCDEGQGDVLIDSSANQRHGKIVGPKWVRAEATSNVPLIARLEKQPALPTTPAVASSAARSFALDMWAAEGLPAPVVTLPAEFDPEQPCTVEMTVCPRRIVGLVEHSGLWMGNGALSLKQSDGRWSWIALQSVANGLATFTNVSTQITTPLGLRTHLAGVYTGKELRLFVDGKLHAWRVVEPLASGNPKHMLGNSTSTAKGTGWSAFDGTIDEVRLSTVARYSDNYTSLDRLEADKDTFALYHCDEGEGDVLVDSSGNKRDGKIIGAKWVRAQTAQPLTTSIAPPVSKDPDRVVAEWALGMGGSVFVDAGGTSVIVQSPDKLPRERFLVADVYLMKCAITDEDLSRLVTLPRLVGVNLDLTAVSDKGLKRLESVSGLSRLYLSRTSITDAAFDTITKFKGLRNLNISATKVTAAGWSRLGELREIEKLGLDGLSVRDEDVAWLVKDFPKLSDLRLGLTEVTDQGLKHLHEAKRLTSISLYKTKTTPAGIQALQAALPDCKIEGVP